MKRIFTLGSILLLFFVWLPAPAGAADKATDLIKKANARIVEAQKSNAGQPRLISEIQKVLEGVTAFDAIAERVTKAVCQDEGKAMEFRNTLAAFLKASYANKLSKYKADKTEYLGESKKGKAVLVRTKVSTGARSINLDYEVEQIKSSFMITNYIVDNINTVDSFKKQFKRSLRKDSLEKVVADLKKKTQRLQSGKAE